MTRLLKAFALSFIFMNMIFLTSCNTVKGTMEGAGKDIQTVTGGGTNKAAAQSQQTVKTTKTTTQQTMKSSYNQSQANKTNNN
ncbi:MAG TPA: hypothetical protein VHM20_00900 [Gammaproteobacteria bacterium]|jgi:predicted small secreted protein|nr:hypothetical protein [Gammaproteobacteria bacterium]